MNKEKALKITKIIFAVLFLVSLGLVYHYESNIKGHYDSNPEDYNTDKEKVISYLNDKGCISRGSLSEHTDFGYFQARYLLSNLSKENLVLEYPNKGICLSLQARVQLALN